MKEIEYSMIRGLLYNEDYFNSCFPHLKSNYFDAIECKRLFELIQFFYNEYNKRPSLNSIKLIVKDSNSYVQTEYDAIMSLYDKLNSDTNETVDYDFLVNETESHCKSQALTQAVFTAAKMIGEDPEGVGAISDIIQEALSVNFDNTVGYDFFIDAKKRFAEYRNKASKIPFGLPELDLFTGGGGSRKELVAYMAPTNNGKTRLMCYNAACFLSGGYNVGYFTLEMEEIKILKRVDAHLLDTDIASLDRLTDEEVDAKMDSIQNKTNGQLVVKQLASGSTAAHIRHQIKELQRKRGIKLDVIIVDYIDICGSYRHPKAEGNDKGKYVSEEIRNLGVEFDALVVTATQTNRSGAKTADVDETAIAESFAKVMTFDTMIALYSDTEMAKRGEQVFTLLKSRDIDKSSVSSQIVGVDSGKMRYISRIEPTSREAKTVMAHEMKRKTNQTLDKLKKKRETSDVQWG